MLQLARAPNSLMMGAAVAVALAVAGRWDSGSIGDLILWAPLAGVAASAVVMVVNDIVDVYVDRVNAPWRPLPSGKVSLEAARTYALVIGIAGLALSSMAGPLTVASFIIVTGLGIAYNLYFKKTGLPGNVVVAGLVASPFAYASLALGRLDTLTLIFAVMVFLSVLAREIVKGIADVEGDSRAGIKTLAVVAGPRAASRVAAALYLAAVALSLLPAAMGLVNHVYTIIVAVIDLLVLREVYMLASKTLGPREALGHKERVLLYMMASLLALAAGSMPGVELSYG